MNEIRIYKWRSQEGKLQYGAQYVATNTPLSEGQTLVERYPDADMFKFKSVEELCLKASDLSEKHPRVITESELLELIGVEIEKCS